MNRKSRTAACRSPEQTTPQPGQLITLECGQTRSRLLPAALVSVSLGDPRANGVAAWLKLAGKIVRIPSSTDEVDHLSAKLRRIRWTAPSSWPRSRFGRSRVGRVNGRDEDASRPDLRRL